MRLLTILLLLFSTALSSQVIGNRDYLFGNNCLALPLDGNSNAELVVKDWSMDNAYDAVSVTQCGTGDNCINSVTRTTWSIETTPPNGNIYCVNESLKLESDFSGQRNSVQINFDLIDTVTYEYTIGMYQASGTNGRIQWGFGTSGGSDVGAGTNTTIGSWVYYSGTFTATATNSQINLYVSGSDAAALDTDEVWYHLTIKEQ
jgi:hypothetical protein